jgi:hypothetical protein
MSHPLPPAQAEVVLGHLCTYSASWVGVSIFSVRGILQKQAAHPKKIIVSILLKGRDLCSRGHVTLCRVAYIYSWKWIKFVSESVHA